jgi:exopolysaccharide biosynthesis polyprenyl glycosylphosphotransferase
VLLLSLRAATRAYARRRPWYAHRTLLVGRRRQAQALAHKLARHPEYGIDLVDTIDLSAAAQERMPGARPRVVRKEDVPGLVEELGVHRVILVSPPRMELAGERFHLARELGERGVRVDLLPAWFEVVGTRLEVHDLEGTSLLTVPFIRLSRGSLFVKRVFDLTVAGLALLLLLPLLIMVALAIKLDSPGPVLFRQRRIGRWGLPFDLVKFRSMTDDADARKDEVADLNFHGGALDMGMFKARQDPRITRVGAFLRRTSLDELPQLWNIVRGDMSMVGPRPLIEPEAAQVEGHFRRRAAQTPGLTGLWQVNGRSEVPFDAMVNLDYLYVTTWSLWGDLKILMKTVPAVLARRGAY